MTDFVEKLNLIVAGEGLEDTTLQIIRLINDELIGEDDGDDYIHKPPFLYSDGIKDGRNELRQKQREKLGVEK